MTESIEKNVLEALQKAVAAATSAPGSLPVKYVNRNFNPPDNGRWWEVVYIPNNIENEFWAEGETYRGIMRLILHWGQDDGGAYDAVSAIDAMKDALPKGSVFQDPAKKAAVRIIDNGKMTGTIEQAPEMLLPLTIKYSCFKI